MHIYFTGALISMNISPAEEVGFKSQLQNAMKYPALESGQSKIWEIAGKSNYITFSSKHLIGVGFMDAGDTCSDKLLKQVEETVGLMKKSTIEGDEWKGENNE